MRVYENKVLKGKFQTEESENKQDAVEWNKMRKCKHFEGYSEITKWARHTEFMGQRRKAHRI
jgi:hypothetical protein